MNNEYLINESHPKQTKLHQMDNDDFPTLNNLMTFIQISKKMIVTIHQNKTVYK